MDEISFLKQKSLPLTLKRHAPAVPCIAFLYSEEHMAVFHVFDSVNLKRSIQLQAQSHIANILAYDIHARIGWVPCSDEDKRADILLAFEEQYGLNVMNTEAA